MASYATIQIDCRSGWQVLTGYGTGESYPDPLCPVLLDQKGAEMGKLDFCCV
jgi:hypothetical protein